MDKIIINREEAMKGRATEVVKQKMVQGCCHIILNRQARDGGDTGERHPPPVPWVAMLVLSQQC